MNIYKELIKLAEANKEGFTVVLHNNAIKPFNGSKGYLISHLTLITIEGKNDKMVEYTVFYDSNQYVIGGWLDKSNGTYYIELNKYVFNYKTALIMAIKHKQKAIWDVENKREIYV